MLHILDYEDKIIDFISEDDASIINAKHNRDINNRSETFDFTILSERARNMQKNYRVIIQDSTGQYREFIIEHISQDMDGYTEIETTASYLEDITGASPYAPGSFEKKTTTEALYDVLKDTGWQVSEATEYGGIRTISWTGFHTRYDILVQLCTTYDMIVDFYIELGSNTVDGRYVVLRKRNPIFQGKEIVKGKDLTGLKRIVDMSEVNTALLCVGPEKEDGSRITLTVKDDEAQAQFGLPGRYIWGIYEPETEDENMTEARLRSLGTTELNKRKKEKISYEVTSLDIKEYQPHEVVHIGDMVRIKDRDFTPPLYLEAEVIAEDYDMVTKESTYSFGEYKEYREDDLRQEFYKHLSNIRQRMNDNFSNVNTIVRETNSQLQYFEKKIIKSQDAPENPVNDMLWLDTSNPKVAVLRRYWNGQWINATAEKADDIDAVTREKALYDDLNNTFINLNIQHSKLLSEVYEVIDSEYLVDTILKQQVQQNLDSTINVYNTIKTNLESMTPETATIGKLVDTQALFLKYRELLKTLYNSLENAKIAIDDRFKLLQSQYTDEKFNDAMSKVAEGIGGTWNAETGQLLADIPSQQELEDALKTYVNGQDAALKQLIDGEVNSKITQTKNELSSNINAVSAKVDGIQVGGRNLVTDSHFYSGSINEWAPVYGTQKVENHTLIKEVTALSTSNRIERIFTNLTVGENYTLSVYTSVPVALEWRNFGNANVMNFNNSSTINKFYVTSVTFTPTDTTVTVRGYLPNAPIGTLIKIDWFKLEKGNKATDWTPAPEDVKADIDKAKAETDKTLSVMQTQINQNGTDINARATKEEFNASRKTLSKVVSDLTVNTTTGLTLSYDENGNIQSHTVGPDGIMLKGDRVNINVNKDFQVLAGNVNNKVGKDEIINRLNLSPEGLDINVNNLGIRGGDTTNYLSIKNQEILSRGTFTRTWGGVTDTPTATVGIKDGYILSRNQKTGYSLYMTEKGLSTMMSGGVGSEQAGALEFHYDLMNDNSRGVRLSSTYGVVFLHAENSRIYTRSRLTTNIETWEASVYIRPQVYSRPGVNEFSFYLKDNDNAKDTDGTLLFGEIYNEAGQAGSGIRFRKAGMPGQTEGEYEPLVYATNKFGDIGTGSFHARNFYGDFQSRSGYLYLKADDRVRITDYKGYNNGNPTYGDLQCRWIQSESIRTTSTNFYIGTSTGEVRITNNLLYNGGDIGYKDIRFKNYVAMSSERYKYDIKEWNYSVLDAYRNDLKLYSYKNKSEKEEEYVRDHHGIIIEREIPIEWRHRDGFDGNEVLFWNTKAIQELIEKVDELEEQINESK